jgi:hypothetical protein
MYFHLFTYNKAFYYKIDVYMLFKCFISLKSAPAIGSAEYSSKSSGANRYDWIDFWLNVKRKSLILRLTEAFVKRKSLVLRLTEHFVKRKSEFTKRKLKFRNAHFLEFSSAYGVGRENSASAKLPPLRVYGDRPTRRRSHVTAELRPDTLLTIGGQFSKRSPTLRETYFCVKT